MMSVMKRTKYFLALGALVSSLYSIDSQAQTIAPQPCDSGYWQVLEARAWQEAEREIMQNQNLIFKADSVMEYTCFDRILAHTALHAGNIFSHSAYFGAPIIPANSSLGLNASMGRLVFDATKIYISDNFGHTYLGGRAGLMASNPADTNMALAPSGGGSSSLYSGSYGTCQMMSGIWQTSKCANFVDNANFQDTDGFYPFGDLAGFAGSPAIAGYRGNRDTRTWATACAGPDSALFADWDAPTTAINTFYQTTVRTPINTIFVDVGNKSRPGNCGTPISTGVTVITGTGGGTTTHLDGVCSNPGCTFTNSGTGAGSCT